MSVKDPAPRARWTTLLASLKTALAILVPAAAILAPILTGAYYLSLAGGSGSAARQMMMLSDPVNVALSLTVVFLPALAAVLAIGAVPLTRGRFPLHGTAWIVFIATVLSGPNMSEDLWRILGFLSALSILTSLAVPDEYPAEMLRLFGKKEVLPEFRGRWATFVRRHRILDRSAVVLAIGSWVACLATVIALVVGLFLTQLLRPQVYELRFSDHSPATQVVWFSTGGEGTWYLTSKSDRAELEDATLGTRDLEWTPLTPASIVTCGLSATPCNAVTDEGPAG